MTARLLYMTVGIKNSRYLGLLNLDNERLGKWVIHARKGNKR